MITKHFTEVVLPSLLKLHKLLPQRFRKRLQFLVVERRHRAHRFRKLLDICKLEQVSRLRRCATPRYLLGLSPFGTLLLDSELSQRPLQLIQLTSRRSVGRHVGRGSPVGRGDAAQVILALRWDQFRCCGSS